ncbi:hypothetical protein BC829DRAFT_388004, partial [Chytridium lagenaria]
MGATRCDFRVPSNALVAVGTFLVVHAGRSPPDEIGLILKCKTHGFPTPLLPS